MDFMTHLPRTSRRHDAVWVIVDWLPKSPQFLVVQMTFTLEEFCRLYVWEILVAQGTSIYSIILGSQVYDSFLEEFPTSHGDTIDDEHNFSSSDGRSVIKDHPDIRGHATGMRP